MFILHASNPVMTLLLALSTVVGSVAAGASYRFGLPRSDSPAMRWVGLLALASIWLVFIPINVWSILVHQPVVWLVGSETIDGGLAENLTITFYGSAIVCALLNLRSPARLFGAKSAPLWRIILMLVVLGSIIMIGEEVSWGQHWLGFATPDQLNKINLQHEANVHNLVSPRLYDEIYQALGWGLILGPVWAQFWASRWQIFSVVRCLQACFASPVTYGLMVSAGILLQHEAFEELSEMVLAMSVFQILLMLLSRSPPAQGWTEPERPA